MYGLSSQYQASLKYENRAIDFIKKTQDMFGVPVWIENANFYSKQASDIRKSWSSIQLIADRSNAKIIVDLAHLIIDAKNLNLSPEAIFGFIPWEAIINIHLSGIIEGKDSSLHDGHGAAVHTKVWDMLKLCFQLNVLPNETWITIEHTDSIWAKNKHIYKNDFEFLEQLLSKSHSISSTESQYYKRQSDYAEGFLVNFITKWIPDVGEACKEVGSDIKTEIRCWLNQRIKIEGKRIVLIEEEVYPGEEKDVKVAANDFIDFLNTKFN